MQLSQEHLACFMDQNLFFNTCLSLLRSARAGVKPAATATSRSHYPYSTSNSTMAERPRELDQRFQVVVNLMLNYRLNWDHFPRHCDMTQFTLRPTHHMVIKPFLLLGLAAEYRSRHLDGGCDQHCGRPFDVYDTQRRTKLTAPETINR